MRFSRAFTMVELVFVIVVLGILAAIAVPRLAATRTDADITKGRADVAAVRSAIVSERQGRLITGDTDWIQNGTGVGQMDEGGLFGGVLMYSVANESGVNGKWSSSAAGTYVFRVNNTNVTFTYDDDEGTFTCNTALEMCRLLVD